MMVPQAIDREEHLPSAITQYLLRTQNKLFWFLPNNIFPGRIVLVFGDDDAQRLVCFGLSQLVRAVTLSPSRSCPAIRLRAAQPRTPVAGRTLAPPCALQPGAVGAQTGLGLAGYVALFACFFTARLCCRDSNTRLANNFR